MKIETDNKLVHLQVEYSELESQTTMLQHQIAPLQQSIEQHHGYLSANPGDRMAMKKYKSSVAKYNSLLNQIRHNQTRMTGLYARITQEQQRLATQCSRRIVIEQDKMRNQAASVHRRMMQQAYR